MNKPPKETANAAAGLDMLSTVKRLSLMPGDTLFLLSPSQLTSSARDSIAATIGDLFPDNKAVILEDGVDVAVVAQAGRYDHVETLLAANREAGERLSKLLTVIGDPGACRSCSATIYWVTTKAGKKTPVDLDGRSHFGTCPNADKHRRKA